MNVPDVRRIDPGNQWRKPGFPTQYSGSVEPPCTNQREHGAQNPLKIGHTRSLLAAVKNRCSFTVQPETVIFAGRCKES